MINSQNKKDDLYWTVLNNALELDFKKGHLKWTISELSRKSKITRTLIYYYFGRSKISILEAAVSIIGEEFVGIANQRVELWQKGQFEESLLEARQFYKKLPFLCAFYLNYRSRPNDIGKALLKLENSFKRKVKKSAPKATNAQINTIFAIYFGIGFSPNVGEAEIKIFAQFINGIFQNLSTPLPSKN